MADIIVILHACDKLKLRIYYYKESKKSVILSQEHYPAINKWIVMCCGFINTFRKKCTC